MESRVVRGGLPRSQCRAQSGLAPTSLLQGGVAPTPQRPSSAEGPVNTKAPPQRDEDTWPLCHALPGGAVSLAVARRLVDHPRAWQPPRCASTCPGPASLDADRGDCSQGRASGAKWHHAPHSGCGRPCRAASHHHGGVRALALGTRSQGGKGHVPPAVSPLSAGEGAADSDEKAAVQAAARRQPQSPPPLLSVAPLPALPSIQQPARSQEPSVLPLQAGCPHLQARQGPLPARGSVHSSAPHIPPKGDPAPPQPHSPPTHCREQGKSLPGSRRCLATCPHRSAEALASLGDI